MGDKNARCYWIIDNYVYEEELELEWYAEEESMGSNELKEQKPCFIERDVPIHFYCLALTLPMDF